MRSPLFPLNVALLAMAFGALLGVIQLGLVTFAFHKLGLSQEGAIGLLFASLLGSWINLPLFHLRSRMVVTTVHLPPPLARLWRLPRWESSGRTLVALNAGGGLIPILFSLYLLRFHAIPFDQALLAIGAVSLISFATSRPIPGIGIGMPMLVGPVSAAVIAVVINPELAAPLAYVGGTLGVLIGADLLRLKDLRTMETPIASVGGAGTFDGIYLTGLVAVLLS